MMLIISLHSCCYLALEEVRSLQKQFNLADELFVVESPKSFGFMVYTMLPKEEFEKRTGLEMKQDLSKLL